MYAYIYTTLYRFIQSFFDRPGTVEAIFSHLSGVFTGYVFRACSKSFCSSVVQGMKSVHRPKKSYLQNLTV